MKLWSYICGIIICFPAFLLAQGTVFTYQGNLSDGAGPANGSYLLTFRLCDAATNGHQIGTNGPTSINITNGLLTATLDFGAAFTGTNYWLEIAVQKGAGPVVTLSPRQPITTVPYAQMAASAAALSGNISITNIPDLSGTYTTRTNNLSDLSSAAAARTNLGINTNFYTLVSDTRGITNAGPLVATNTNNVFTAGQFTFDTMNHSTVFHGGGYGRWQWNSTVGWISPDDPYFSFFLNLGHGSIGGDGSELQLTFNQMYFGPFTGGHVQFGLASDALDTFYFNRSQHTMQPYGQSHILSFKYSYYSTTNVESFGRWDIHATNYDYSSGGSFLRFLSATNDSTEDGHFADGVHDTGLRLNSLGAGGAEFTGFTRQAISNAFAGGNFAIDFLAQGSQVVSLTRNTTFSITNLSWLTNFAQTVDLWLYPGPPSWSLTWPAAILWESESGQGAAPTNAPGGYISHVRLTAVYGATTNIIGHAWLAPYSTSYDSDASKFFSASGISNATEKAAVNQLVLDLKAHSLWSRMDCVYPLVGGTSNSCSWNLRDTNKYRIAWSALAWPSAPPVSLAMARMVLAIRSLIPQPLAAQTMLKTLPASASIQRAPPQQEARNRLGLALCPACSPRSAMLAQM